MSGSVFVYSGASSPESEIKHSPDGAASDHWVQSSDGGEATFTLRRQSADGQFRDLHVNRLSETQREIFLEIGERFSPYHVDALQEARKLYHQHVSDNAPT